MVDDMTDSTEILNQDVDSPSECRVVRFRRNDLVVDCEDGCRSNQGRCRIFINHFDGLARLCLLPDGLWAVTTL